MGEPLGRPGLLPVAQQRRAACQPPKREPRMLPSPLPSGTTFAASLTSVGAGLADAGGGDVVGDVAGARGRVWPPATRPGITVLAEAAPVGGPTVELGPDGHLVALDVVLIRDRDADHAGVDGRGEPVGRRVIADDLQPLDLVAREVQFGALLQEEPAGQPLEAQPSRDVVLLGVERAAGHGPGAGESLQARERGVWSRRQRRCLGVLVLRHDDLLDPLLLPCDIRRRWWFRWVLVVASYPPRP